MGRDLPAIHGDDHLPWGPDPIRGVTPLEVSESGGGYDATEVSHLEFSGVSFDLSGIHPFVDLADYTAFAPALTATGTDPTGYTGGGHYVRLGKLVHYHGSLVFSNVAPTAGTGAWQLGLPVASAMGSEDAGFGYLWRFTPPAQRFQFFASTGGSLAVFLYPDAWPSGNETTVDGSALPFVLGQNDILYWNMVYHST